MAPEQRDGGRADERADVYSAGATLFEMLTGRRFKNEVSKSRAALAAVMRAEGVEAWLADAVAWAVDEQPDQRPQSARALLDALEGPPRSSSRGRSALIGVGAIAAVAVGVALTLQSRDDGEAAASATALDPRMVAFVPFAEETGDETLAFTAHGVPRALGTRLHAAVPSAHVLGYDALRDVLPPGEHGRDAWIDVARERGADVIVAGSVDDAAEGVTIRCDLLRSSSGPSFERAGVVSVSGRTADIDGLIAEAAAAVAERLYGERPSAEALGSIHALEALRGHQHGVDALRRARFNEAVESLEDVVSLEPDYPEAWYHLSIARTWLGGVGQRDAFRAIDRALALVEGRREQTLLRAMRLMTEERPTEAAELLEPLRADYPRDRDVLYTLGEAYHHGGDVAAGLSAFRAALRVSPGFLPSVVHPIRVYQARRDEQNARECIAIRRTYGEDDMAAHDEHILDFALGRYDEILERPIPQGPVYTRRGAMLAQIGALLVKGEDDRARGLLVGGMGELRHTVIQWNAATLLAAIAYRRQDRAAVRRFTGAAALWASQLETTYRRGEARAALGMVRGMAGDRPGALEDLSAVDSEDYGARTPRTVFAFRALVGRMTGEERLLSSALAAPDRDVRMLAEGLREEMRGDHHAAAAALALALDEPTEGYFDLVILDALARNRRALGDVAGAQAACNEIERPAIYHPYREPAVARCRAER